MGAFFTEGDINYLRSLYPEADIKEPTKQQEQLISHYFRGKSIAAAAKAAGYKSSMSAREFIESEGGVLLMRMLRDREFDDIRVDIETLTGMFFEAYNLAATSAEKIAATRELGKLHGIYPDSKRPDIVINNPQFIASQKNIQRLTDAQLAEMAGPEMLQLMYSSNIDDANIVVIENEAVEA